MRALPDVTSESSTDEPSTLQWVGMEDIAVPIRLNPGNGELQTLAAKTNVFISLDKPEAKGIHMSRLHLLVNQLAGVECTQSSIRQILDNIVDSQSDLGNEARLELRFEPVLKKPALLSEEFGYQSYPITMCSEKTELGYTTDFELTIPYSSTSPCSASLARQMLADAVDEEFSDSESINKESLLEWIQSPAGSIATPHSQRSYATIRISLGDGDWPDLAAFIFQLEKIIGTPVQTAVKRRDEQEFARLNAENLMFCEDAARRIKSALEGMSFVKDYLIKVEHQESLHAHNAVVFDQKYR